MSLIQNKCIEYHDDRSECVATENGKTYRLNNRSKFKVRKIKSDGCLPQKVGEKRCDYIIDYYDGIKPNIIFIELKGGALNMALGQIFDTIVYLKNELKDHKINARIVGSKDVPNFAGLPAYRKLGREILHTKGTIERRTNNIYTETI